LTQNYKNEQIHLQKLKQQCNVFKKDMKINYRAASMIVTENQQAYDDI